MHTEDNKVTSIETEKSLVLFYDPKTLGAKRDARVETSHRTEKASPDAKKKKITSSNSESVMA